MDSLFDLETQPFIFTTLWQWLKNTYGAKAEKHPEDYVRWNTIRTTCKEFLMSWCLRMRDIHLKPPMIARFSMLLQFHQCPMPIWSVLSHLRLAFSVNTTKRMYEAAIAIPISIRCEWPQHGTIGMVGVDNMSYITYNAQVRIQDENIKRYHLITIVIILLFL